MEFDLPSLGTEMDRKSYLFERCTRCRDAWDVVNTWELGMDQDVGAGFVVIRLEALDDVGGLGGPLDLGGEYGGGSGRQSAARPVQANGRS